jgi:MFS family permease
VSTTFRSFAVANYRLWFAGALVSNIGTWMQRIGQDWLILTQLTDGNATAVGVASALQFGPQLLLLPLTGFVADRYDRRRVLMITQATMGLLGLGLGLITVLGVVELWMVFGFALALGVAAAFDAPARQAFVGELVPEALLSNAVALNSASFNGARLVGPALAGLLTAAVGAGWAFLVNAATFGAVLIALALLRTDQFTPIARTPHATGQLRAGFRYVRRRPDIQLVLWMVFIIGLLGFNFPIFISTMALIEFGLGPSEFGLLSSALAIGSLTGALVAARRERARLRTVTIASAAAGVALALAAIAPNVWVFGVTLVLVGLAGLTMMTSANGYVQTTTTPKLRGRVMALYLAVFLGGTPIGALLVGWVADAFGPRWALAVGASSGLLAAGIAVVFYIRTRRARLSWDREARWPLGVTTAADRDTTTSGIAIVEAESQR